MKINIPEQLIGCVNPGNWSMLKTQVPGEDILAEDWNAEFLNVIANSNPAGLAAAASDAASMRETLNPYPSGDLVIPDSLCEELRMYRYVINNLAGTEYWYQVANITGKSVVTGGDLHNHLGTDVDPVNGGGALIGTDAIEDKSITKEKLADSAVPLIIEQIVTDAVTGTSPDYTAIIPFDNTIPQINEGTEILTLSITPKQIGNIIRIGCFTNHRAYGNGTILTGALFIDGGTDAIEGASEGGGNEYNQLHLKYEYEVVDTNAHVFSVRIGTQNGSTYSINPLLGGIGTCYLEAIEYYKETV